MPFVILFLLIVGVALWLWTQNNALFTVHVRHGRIVEVQGQLTPQLLSGIREIVAFPPIAEGTISAARSGPGAALSFTGDIDEGQAQRIRNTFHMSAQSRFQSDPSPLSREKLTDARDLASLLARVLRRR